MAYTVEFTREALSALRALRATDMTRITDQCRQILAVNPTLVSKARIKRLRGDVFPPYRLRVGEYRVFYDVAEETQMVTIYGVVIKSEVDDWLSTFEGGRNDEDENIE